MSYSCIYLAEEKLSKKHEYCQSRQCEHQRILSTFYVKAVARSDEPTWSDIPT